MSEAQNGAIPQFNFVGQPNVPLREASSQGGPSTGQFGGAAHARQQYDLSLSLGRQEASSGLLRSTSLANSLAINERGPLPPRDFLSLSRSCSFPTGAVHHHHRHHQVQPELQTSSLHLLDYQRRRLLEQQRKVAQERTLQLRMASTHQRHQVPIIQQQVMTVEPAPQQWNQQVMMLPQQQAVTVLSSELHRHLQQQPVMVVPRPAPQQLLVVPRVQGLRSGSHQPPYETAVVASGTTGSAFCRALNYIASQAGQSSGLTIKAPLEGSSSCISAQTNVTPPVPATHNQAAYNKGKHPLLLSSETAPLYMSSGGSNWAGPVDSPDSEFVAKKMRLMKEQGLEDGMEVMREMPGVAFKQPDGGTEGKRTEGFLYRYNKGGVSIVCNCHGTFLTPAEFVEHAGGADMDNPMKRITVCSHPIL